MREVDFSARWRSVEMTRGSLGRNDRSFVISSGGVAGVEKSAGTGRVTKRPINVISGVLEHGAGDDNARKCYFSRAEGASGRAGGERLGTIWGIIVRKWGPGGTGCVHYALGLYSSGDSAGGGSARGGDSAGGVSARGPR